MKRTLVLIGAMLLAGCNGDLPGEWAAIVYPNASDRSNFITTYGFQNQHMCKRAASESIDALPEPAKADYRCGFMCEPDPKAPGHPVCKSLQKQ